MELSGLTRLTHNSKGGFGVRRAQVLGSGPTTSATSTSAPALGSAKCFDASARVLESGFPHWWVLFSRDELLQRDL